MLRLLLSLVLLGSVFAAQKPNIIVIFTDDQGWADLGCQGSLKDIRTPHIDKMAADGVRCTNGYITAPQCIPSRAGLLAAGLMDCRGQCVESGGTLEFTSRSVTNSDGESEDICCP